MSSNEFKRGILYNALGKYSNVVIQLVVNIVLSRILTPEDYGVVAVVQIFLAFFQMLADMGFGPAIIQNKTLTESDISVIFKVSIYMAIGLSFIFMLLGYPISKLYNNSAYIPIFYFMGICVFFYALLGIPQSLLQKEKDFKSVNLVTVYSGLGQGIISIILALLGFSYFSIIIGNIVKAMIMFIAFYSKTKISPKSKFLKEPLKKIWKFAKNQFGFNFINYFSRNVDSILIGAIFPSTALAYYNKSYQLSLYPNQLLSGVISPVIQPFMAEHEDNKEIIKNVYLRMTKILANIGITLSVFCFFSAKEIILFLFGNQWGGSVLTFQILAVSIWIQMIASSSGAIYQSANRTDLLLFSGTQSMIANVTAITVGVLLGSIEWVAAMVVLSFGINFLVNNYLLMYRVFNSSFLELCITLSKPVIIGLLQIICFMALPELQFSIFTNLLIQVLVCVILFILGLIITNQVQEVKNIFLK